MKKTLTFVLSFITFLYPISASAVENGTSAVGDLNAVSVNGAGGFLYSSRIVLTTAHNHLLPHEITNVQVGLPGDILTANNKKILVEKIFVADTFIDRTFLNGGNIFSRTDDFAVLVLSEPIPVKNNIKIATQEQLEYFKANHSQVSMVGYGLQTADMRIQSNNGRNPVDISPQKINSTFLSDQEAQIIIRNSLGSNAVYKQDAYFTANITTGSLCDNDSGSGWFVDQDNIRYYIGPASGGMGFPNCGSMGIWGTTGSFASVSAAYKFLDLIAKAEQYVQEHPYANSNQIKTTIPDPVLTVVALPEPTNNPVAVAQHKILCQKKMIKRYYNATKCPSGYKLIKKIA